MLGELRLDDAAPWKQRFRAPVTLWTQLAKVARNCGLLASNRTGVFQLYAWDVPSGELTQLTDRPDGKLDGLLSPDGHYVYYLDDRLGNEIGHYVRVPFEGGAPADITSDLPPYSSWSLDISRAGNLLGFTLADREGFHTYLMDLGPDGAIGALRRLFDAKSVAFGPLLAHGAEIAVMASSERSGKPQFSLVALDAATGERLGELWDGPETSVEPSMFSPVTGDFRLLATTDRSGVKRPLIWNAHSGAREELQLDEIAGEVTPLDWSLDGQRLLLQHVEQAVQHLYLYDLQGRQLVSLRHPNGTFWGTYFGPAGEIFTQWNDAANPPQLIALDAETGERRRTVLPAGEVPPGHPVKSVTFCSSDGQDIQGWLAIPEGAGPFPTILETHGGPHGVETEGFSPGSQAWLDHGFAFLTINYRGSTTFGKQFQEQIWGDLGHWEVEDMVAARAWLVQEGIAHPDQIFLTGWSYGGYLTLQALGKYPELWAGGMAGIAIADWAVMYEDSADTLRAYQVAIFGGTPEEKPEQYAASSPITYAERVRAPVLIIQGRNDTRTPPRPIEMYEAQMKSLGKPIEIHWYDTGHVGSFAQVDLAIQHQELMLRFADRVLRGSKPEPQSAA